MTQNNTKNIRCGILSTIAYFDIFDFPLTAWEVYRKFIHIDEYSPSYFEILKEISFLLQKKIISFQNGMYMISGREKIAQLRMSKMSVSIRKLRIARKYISILSFMPFVRMIGIINTLSYGNARDESDVDILIVSAHKRMWTARFFAVSFLKIFRLRPTPERRKDTLCLNMFLDEINLDLSTVALEPSDIHFAHIVSHFLPVYDRGNYYEKYLKSNTWIFRYFKNFLFFPPHFQGRTNQEIPFYKRFLEKIFYLFPDELFRRFQISIMPQNLKNADPKLKNVILSKHILKFHVNDRRREINRQFQEVLSALSEKENEQILQ